MAMYRKLGKKSDQRIALLRNQVTQLLYHGKIETTEARAKEVRKIAEHLITLAVKEKDNFDEIKVTAKVAKKDKDGKRIKEVVDGKKVTQYDEVEKTVKKDQKAATKKVDLTAKLFDEYAAKYASRKGGYTRIVKIGERRGDGAMKVILELV